MHLIGEKEREKAKEWESKEMNGVKDTQRGRYGEETEIETHSKTDWDGEGYGEAEERLEYNTEGEKDMAGNRNILIKLYKY